jgi:hypothetical protein
MKPLIVIEDNSPEIESLACVDFKDLKDFFSALHG